MATAATTLATLTKPGDAATFYYFLVGAHGAPYRPPVLATETADRRVGEVIALEDGSRVRVRGIEMTVDAGRAGRGFDGVLVVDAAA